MGLREGTLADSAIRFIEEFDFADASVDAVTHAKRCLLDLVGVAAAGSTTRLSHIIRDHVAEQFAAGKVGRPLLFDHRSASAVGAALANGMTIDAFDAHDGHPETKGHAGCGLLAGLLSFADPSTSGEAFLADLIVGYEVAIRAGLALHKTVSDYHTSGAWVAIGVAATGARRLSLPSAQIQEAIGIAEYHGPRSQMMRCIEHPTMVKDGSGWGAMAGVSAALLARDGFTGAPAITVLGDDILSYWTDLGERWTITEQYLKPYPVCRWAQPALEAARQIGAANPIDAAKIEEIEVRTFHEAAQLATSRPANTEQAQYSLPHPLAAFLVRGKVGPEEISGAALEDPEIGALADKVRLVEEPAYSAKFPVYRIAQMTISTADGLRLQSSPVEAPGGADNPLSDLEVSQKYHALMKASGLQAVAREIEDLVGRIDTLHSIAPFLDALRAGPDEAILAGAAQ